MKRIVALISVLLLFRPILSAAVSDTMPAMIGTSLVTVLEKAEEFGLSVMFDDDFGHGTHCASYWDSSEGLSLDIVYSTNTNEILCATIVTFQSISSDAQIQFIKSMAPVLCPFTDQDTVSSWVNSNVGSNSETEISGFSYETLLGPTDNACYNAGVKNWEEWALAQ